MIPNIPHQGAAHLPAHRSTASTLETPPSAEPAPAAGKASAPGQVAKALIAEATANGAQLPANIQGKAASAIAHGMDMENFFASFMSAPEPPVDEVPDGGIGGGEIAAPDDPGGVATTAPDSEIPVPERGPDSEAISSPALAPDDQTTIPLTSAGSSSYEIATTLLEPLVAPESETVV